MVFVILLCDGSFPSIWASECTDGKGEESRRFYLAITRAKHDLYLTCPTMRGGFAASRQDTYQSPSRLLAQIPEDLLNEWTAR